MILAKVGNWEPGDACQRINVHFESLSHTEQQEQTWVPLAVEYLVRV